MKAGDPMAHGEISRKTNFCPTLQDYNEAVQTPFANLRDAQLRNGMPFTDAMGLPRPITGSFASVYRMHCTDSDFALRLFLRNIQDQSARYSLISKFLKEHSLPYCVSFEFLDEGIKTHGVWVPALKMKWVEGQTLDAYIVERVMDSRALGRFLDNFVSVTNSLRKAGIAHGDLQHGNIMMCSDDIRLVDYDGMYVPSMHGQSSSELGHPNYQRPGRLARHFGPYLDNFSAWVIYASIRTLQLDPAVLHQVDGGDDCLLFRRGDFEAPQSSKIFGILENHAHAEIRRLGKFVREQLAVDIEKIPHLQWPRPDHEPVSHFADSVGSWLNVSNVKGLLTPQRKRVEIVDDDARQARKLSAHVPPTATSSWVQPSLKSAAGSAGRAAENSALVSDASKNALFLKAANDDSKFSLRWRDQLKTSPWSWQALMVLNPLVWVMCINISSCWLTDSNLKTFERPYETTVTKVGYHYEDLTKGGRMHYTDVEYKFNVDGKVFQVDRSYSYDSIDFMEGKKSRIFALPTDPTINEGVGKPAGHKFENDLLLVMILAIVNVALEILIWKSPLRQMYLVKFGVPTLARVEKLNFDALAFPMKRTATLSYWWYDRVAKATVTLNDQQYHSLREGKEEMIYCNRSCDWDVSIVRFCDYERVPKKKH